VTLFVEKNWLSSNKVHEWSLQFNRFDESSSQWRPVQAKRVREDESRVFFSVVVPGFSQWTITGSQDAPEVTFLIENLTIGPRDPKAGEDVSIQVDVTNLTDQEQELNLALWLNDQIDSMKRIIFLPGDKRPVPFIIQPREGEFDVRVDRLRGTMSVAPSDIPPTVVAPPVVSLTPAERGSGATVGVIIGLLAAIFVGGSAASVLLGRYGSPEGSGGGSEPTPPPAEPDQPATDEPAADASEPDAAEDGAEQ
jgi:hypothetical protein